MYVGIPHFKKSKLDPKAKKGFLVGYAFNTKGYRNWISETDQIVESISLSFKEVSNSESVSEHSGATMGPDFCDPFSVDPR